MYSLNKSLLYMLIFTIIGSALAYKLVVTAYEGAYDESTYEAMIIKSK